MRIIAGASFMFLMGCGSFFRQSPDFKPDSIQRFLENEFLEFQPIDPLPSKEVEVFENGALIDKFWLELDNEVRRDLLPLQSSSVYISQRNKNGKLSYLTASVSAEVGSYFVIMDYMKFQVRPILAAGGKILGYEEIGIGLRIKAAIVTKKANLNLGSILNLGIEADLNNLSGGMSVDVIGIDSEDVTNLIPLTSEIDQTAIQSALQALASIKTKIYAQGTKIFPHRVAIKPIEKDARATILAY